MLGFGITKLEFATGQDSYLNKSDQVYKDNVAYQDLFGGQAMLTLVTMDEGHTVDELFTRRTSAQFDRRRTTPSTRQRQGARRRHARSTALEFNDDARRRAPTATRRRASRARRCLAAQTQRRAGPPARPRRATADAVATLGRVSAIPAAERTLDNPEWVKFLLHDNQGKIRKPLLPFFPDERARADRHPAARATQSIEDEGAAADFVDDDDEDARASRTRRMVTTGAPVLLKNINDYLKGGMLTLGAIAVAIMVVILLVLFNVRWRLLPLGVVLIGVIWAFGLAGYLGIPLTLVTIAGLPVMLGIGIDYAIQMHARVEEEVDHRPRRAPDPGDGPQPRPRAARRHVRRDLRLRRAALRQGADAPPVRPAARRRHRRDLPVQHHRPARDPRHPRVQVADQGPRLPRRVRSAASSCGSARCPSAVAPRSRSRASLIFAGGLIVEDKLVLQTDPIQWVNQNSQVDQGPPRRSTRETGSSSELGVFVQSTSDVFTDRRVDFVDEFTHGTARRSTPARSSPASSIVDDVSDLTDVPGATDVTPTGARRAGGLRRRAARHPAARPSAPTARPLNLIFRTGPAVARRSGPTVVREIRETSHPPDGVDRHAVGARGRRRRPARQPRGEPHPAHLPRDPASCSCSSRSGCAASSARCCRSCRCSSRSAPRRSSRARSASSSAR